MGPFSQKDIFITMNSDEVQCAVASGRLIYGLKLPERTVSKFLPVPMMGRFPTHLRGTGACYPEGSRASSRGRGSAGTQVTANSLLPTGGSAKQQNTGPRYLAELISCEVRKTVGSSELFFLEKT